MARPPAFGDRGAHSKVRSGKRQRLRAGLRGPSICDSAGFYAIWQGFMQLGGFYAI
jgi:hypothetical protein